MMLWTQRRSLTQKSALWGLRDELGKNTFMFSHKSFIRLYRTVKHPVLVHGYITLRLVGIALTVTSV